MKPFRYEPEGLVWLDGAFVPAADATVGIADPAIQSGLGVFETIAVRDGRPLDLAEHLERLAHGALRMAVDLPVREALDTAARQVAREIQGSHGWVKIVAVRGGRTTAFGGRMDAEEEGRSVGAVLLPWRQNAHDAIAGLKTISYASHVLGLEEARRRGADEGIWLNTRGHVAEGCTSTVFVVTRRRVFTPGLSDGILPGIVRGFVLRAAKQLGIVVHEGKVRLRRLETADEAFLTSSLRGVRPLVRFDGHPVGKGTPGPVTLALAREVSRLRLGGAGG
jgi:branched-subunit amino acid aminotransferase/4-amino-4-deoxychorismate lyase